LSHIFEFVRNILQALGMKREVDIVILSDLHLGTHGCHAAELLDYLKSIQPNTLILNGDIIDMWHFKKSYFPPTHMEVVRRILKMASQGVKVYYLTGNHDDALRSFGEVNFGQVQLRNKLVFNTCGKTYWVFHGDVFDVSIGRGRWLAKVGGKGYDLLIRVNRRINRVRQLLGLRPVSFSAKVKQRVKSAVKHISDFEQTAIDLALEKGYDYVVCGHIHIPQIKTIRNEDGQQVTYLNSGDWVENNTALEFQRGEWSIFKYDADDFAKPNPRLVVRPAKQSFGLNLHEILPELPASKVAFEPL
jgi:UDP-2,3-diacylglucosamine pyrophosphatase LpxH